MALTTANLIRLAGAAAVAAGLILIGVQINHPHADVAAVTTTEWAVRGLIQGAHGRTGPGRPHRACTCVR